MKRLYTFTLITLWLAACSPVEPTATIDDPNISLAIAQAQLTGTAQAFQMQLVQWTATAQSWTPTPSLTPAPTSTPTITATPTVNVTGTLAVEKMNAEINNLRLEQERKQSTNLLLAAAPYVVGFLALGLALFIGVIAAKRLSLVPTPIHESTGKPQPLLNVIDGTIVDVDRLTNGAGQATGAWVRQLPKITAERQDVVTNRAQLVDLQTRRKNLPASLVKAQAKNLLEAPNQDQPQLEAGEAALFPLPSWEIINGWEPKGTSLPYGVTARGLGLVDVQKYPHLATIGATGTGKSRRFMRPIIAAALAAGHRVVIVGKATDYQVFINHPNARMVKVNQMTNQHAAALYAQTLKACVDEMNRRDDRLSAMHRSTWAEAGFGHTFIVLDELGNALRLMPSAIGEQARIWVEGLVSEGRKAGLSVMLANQRATGMATILSQTGKAIFRVERDEEKAHRSLIGASGLHEGYFYMKAGEVNLAGGFEPTDAEIGSFLSSRRVQTIESEPWLEGIASQTSLPEAEGMPTASLPDTLSPEEREQVETLLLGEGDLTPSAIVREVWQVTGGDKWRRLKSIVEQVRSDLIDQRLAEGI